MTHVYNHNPGWHLMNPRKLNRPCPRRNQSHPSWNRAGGKLYRFDAPLHPR
ncbi:hypothetical protein HMPREF9278_1481 [Mobiluncus mulieris FB024-16]|nr:hypothetical protein HMPREF9278_1481 [Mobiluncus mulieris FB024-16]